MFQYDWPLAVILRCFFVGFCEINVESRPISHIIFNLFFACILIKVFMQKKIAVTFFIEKQTAVPTCLAAAAL